VSDIDLVLDAEVVEPLDQDHGAAERLDKRIRLLVGTINNSISKLYTLVEEAKSGQIHLALGFPSWTAYVADVFSVDVLLNRDLRSGLVCFLSDEGMSERAIASITGAAKTTVHRDLEERDLEEPGGPYGPPNRSVTGLDGKTYTAKPNPVPAPRKSFSDVVNCRFMALSDDIGRLEQLVRSDRFKRNQTQLEGVERIPEILQRFRARLAAVAEISTGSQPGVLEAIATVLTDVLVALEFVPPEEAADAKGVQHVATILDLLDEMPARVNSIGGKR
jgi:hypothetical protein